MNRARLCFLLLFLAGCTSEKDPGPGPRDGFDLLPTSPGRVKVGMPAPDFTLESKDAEMVTLSQFRERKNIVMVFYRGYWCPFCVAQLAELKPLAEDPALADTQVIAVAVDPRADLEKMCDAVSVKKGSPPNFIFLSDPEHRVINRYGILNESGNVLPYPATYVIDKEGIVRWRSVDLDFRHRPSSREILDALESLP
jgi:peroxiredoxin